jgi:ubiquitin-conjugating enzyme E2 M
MINLKLNMRKSGRLPSPESLTPAHVRRMQKDLAQLSAPSGVTVRVPDPTKLTEFYVSVKPDEGFYAGGTYVFRILVPDGYPHDGPRLLCTTPVIHPNIQGESVCLLRGRWNPVMTTQTVLVGLKDLFANPNTDDPLDKDAADRMVNDPEGFRSMVLSMRRSQY